MNIDLTTLTDQDLDALRLKILTELYLGDRRCELFLGG